MEHLAVGLAFLAACLLGAHWVGLADLGPAFFGRWRTGALVSAALAIVLAVVLFSARAGGESQLALLGRVAAIGGLLLLAYAVVLHRSEQPSAGSALA